jgi:prevent-host-death family protein
MILTLRESKAKLSALVAIAAGGEEVVITVRGRPRARLCALAPVAPADQRQPADWETGLREARETYSAGVHDTGAAILDDLRGDRA